MKIEDETIKALATSLDFRQMRQKMISSNVANAETPNYKAKRLDFEEALARAINLDKDQNLDTNHKRHFNVAGGGFESLSPSVYDDPNGVVSDDGNTVNKEEEMSRMAANEILYDASVQLLSKKLGLMKYTISTDR